MAELNLQQISDKLNEEFALEGRRLVFWFDENAEFVDDIDKLELQNAKILRLKKDTQLYTKYFLEKEDTETNYLIYAPFAKPEIESFHLADTIHYSKEFFVDRVSLICADLGISDEFKPVLYRYVKFFAARERTQRFYALDVENYNRNTIETALISAVCRLKSVSFEDSLRVILTDDLNDNKYLAELKKYSLDEPFWTQVDMAFGYTDADPTLEKMLMCLFVTYSLKATGCEPPTSWKPYNLQKPGNAIVFLENFMNNTVYSDRFNELSEIIYKSLNGENVFAALPVEELIDCNIFRGIDEPIISWMTERLENEDTAATMNDRTIPEIALLRRKQHFGEQFCNKYFVIENAYYIIKDAKYSAVGDVDDIIKEYTSQWYKIDTRYRCFNFYYDKLGGSARFEKLRMLVENIYTNEYLNKIAGDWCNSFAESSGNFNTARQQDFFRKNISQAKDRVCVIISDALRYEVGMSLFDALQADEKCTAEITPMISVLPSITQTGMAALLPHKTYSLNADIKAEIDGKCCDNTQSREAHLKSYVEASRCVQFDELKKMNKDELREIFTDQKLIYVYHNQIDAAGDNAKSEDEVFTACEEAVSEIKTLIRRLTTSANTSHFIVTADHGFLYKRDRVYESQKISGISGAALLAGKRFAISNEPFKIEGIKNIPLNVFYGKRDGFVCSPVGSDIIKSPGNGLNYVHGGCSPQEMIVPVIDVKTDKSHKDTKKAAIALVTPLRKLTNLAVTLEFIQSDAVSDIVKEATYRVFFVSEDGEVVSNENFIIADKTDTDAAKRLYKLRFNLKNKSYSKSKKYYLVALDDSSGFEILRTETVIENPFAGNFGF
ncbi:MAG: BREX-1 system phosphatase PglZ type A [Oscillospiraceae bacterium]|nr:BREX-1 system phosphatase PglZ type A [Oscillospiraceae bacterium]